MTLDLLVNLDFLLLNQSIGLLAKWCLFFHFQLSESNNFWQLVILVLNILDTNSLGTVLRKSRRRRIDQHARS